MTTVNRGPEEEDDSEISRLTVAYDEKLKWFYKRTLIAFAVVFLSTAATVFYVYTSSESNRQSLCTLRQDAEVRVAQGEQFLKDNPNGIPGISPAVIQRSLQSSKQTIASLSNLNCGDISQKTATDGAN